MQQTIHISNTFSHVLWKVKCRLGSWARLQERQDDFESVPNILALPSVPERHWWWLPGQPISEDRNLSYANVLTLSSTHYLLIIIHVIVIHFPLCSTGEVAVTAVNPVCITLLKSHYWNLYHNSCMSKQDSVSHMIHNYLHQYTTIACGRTIYMCSHNVPCKGTTIT